MTTGEKVFLFRTKRKLTQDTLAERSGVSVRNIRYIENTNSDCKVSILKKLAKALGCDVKDLL